MNEELPQHRTFIRFNRAMLSPVKLGLDYNSCRAIPSVV